MADLRVADYGPVCLRKTRHFIVSASLLAVDPLIDCGSAESPQFAHLNTCDLPPKHHALESPGMNSKHSGGGVAVEEWFHARPAEDGEQALSSGRFFLVRHFILLVRALKVNVFAGEVQ
jgi:hypothetical protein